MSRALQQKRERQRCILLHEEEMTQLSTFLSHCSTQTDMLRVYQDRECFREAHKGVENSRVCYVRRVLAAWWPRNRSFKGMAHAAEASSVFLETEDPAERNNLVSFTRWWSGVQTLFSADGQQGKGYTRT